MTSFQFLTVKQLEANIENLLQKAIDKYGDRENVPDDRSKQFNLLNILISQLQSLELAEETRSKIITGALMHIKFEIESACKENAAWWFKHTIHHPERYIYKPENSIIYSNIDHAMGISDTNLLDEESEKNIKEVFSPYLKRINLCDDIKEKNMKHLKHHEMKKSLTLMEEIRNFNFNSLHYISKNNPKEKLPIKIFKRTEAYMQGENLTRYKYYKIAKAKYKAALTKDKMSKERMDELNQIKESIKFECAKTITEAFSKKKLSLDFFSKEKGKNKEKFPKEKIEKMLEGINRSIDTAFTEEVFSDVFKDGVHEQMIDKLIDKLFLELSPAIKQFDPAILKHVETRVKSVIPFLEELRIEELENAGKEKLKLSR